MKLEISLFRFDYKSDYLPYYTKSFIKVKNEKTLLDILDTINKKDPFKYKNSESFSLVVNGIYTTTMITINELVETFGKDLIIEPLSIKRATNDLLINDSDFQEKLKLLSNFTDEDDILKYQNYKIYFYASNTMNFEYNYIGDSLLLLSYDLIQKYPSKGKDILEVLKNYEYGAHYHTSLKNRVLNLEPKIEKKIGIIREKLNILKDIKEQEFNLEKAKTIDFSLFDENKEIKYDFSNFNIAYYKGLKEDKQTSTLLSKLNIKNIDSISMTNDLALETFHLNKEFTFKLASKIMLDAFDNGADLIIVDNTDTFKLFDSNRKALNKVSGREVIIPILHKNELAMLAYGEHEKVKPLLEQHTINPEII